jgi:8-oxo-dGTP pyrophosphatase MutT (NUDIX family)
MMAAQIAVQQACERLLSRLSGSMPDHRPERLRIGTGSVDAYDPRLQQLLPSQPQAAAVLIGLNRGGDDPGILLTVRADHLRHHAGQISFPGGRIEAGDAGPAAAALREAQEEIGLPVAATSVVGYLPDQIVLTGFRITPVIALLPAQFTPRIDNAEVQGIFELPLSVLLDCASHHETRRSYAGIDVSVRDIHFGEHRIWGATAGMLLSLYDLAQP